MDEEYVRVGCVCLCVVYMHKYILHICIYICIYIYISVYIMECCAALEGRCPAVCDNMGEPGGHDVN